MPSDAAEITRPVKRQRDGTDGGQVAPGEHFFRCDVHPNQMAGTPTVEDDEDSRSQMNAAWPALGDLDATERVELARFVTRYIGSPLQLEILIHLAYHPDHFSTLEDLRILAGATPGDIESASIELEDRGLLVIQRRGHMMRVKLRQTSVVLRPSELLLRCTYSSGGMARLLNLVRRRKMSRTAASTRACLATLGSLIGRHLTSRPRLDLLVFLGRYWGGWFSRLAIDPLSVFPREAIDEALDGLVDEGVIETVEDGEVTYYRLTTDPRVRPAVVMLARLPLDDRGLLFRRCMGQDAADVGDIFAAPSSSFWAIRIP